MFPRLELGDNGSAPPKRRLGLIKGAPRRSDSIINENERKVPGKQTSNAVLLKMLGGLDTLPSETHIELVYMPAIPVPGSLARLRVVARRRKLRSEQ